MDVFVVEYEILPHCIEITEVKYFDGIMKCETIYFEGYIGLDRKFRKVTERKFEFIKN